MKKFFVIGLLVLALMPVIALAQTTTPINACSKSSANFQIGACINQIYLWSLGVAGIIAISMMIYGGFKVMTAAGNGAQASDGKSYLTSSIIGLVILLSAYLILNFINPDLTNFNFTPAGPIPAATPNTNIPPRGNTIP